MAQRGLPPLIGAPWEREDPETRGQEGVELFLTLASARNAMNASMASVLEAHKALGRGDVGTAVERFGVAHEDLHETTLITKQFPAHQAMRILESPDYRKLLVDLQALEEAIVARCERGPFTKVR